MFKDFKPVLGILIRFFAIYLVMILLYQLFLNHYQSRLVDPITEFTAFGVHRFQQWLGYNSQLQDLPGWHSILFILNGKSTTRIVEGCNAVSIMILFVAFILAFYKGAKTFVFVALALIFLIIINIIRIAGLNILYLHWPQYSKIGHDYVFPAIIYGSIVVFWLIWIKKFVLRNEKS
jgi:exosortase family protein XrtF